MPNPSWLFGSQDVPKQIYCDGKKHNFKPKEDNFRREKFMLRQMPPKRDGGQGIQGKWGCNKSIGDESDNTCFPEMGLTFEEHVSACSVEKCFSS